MLQSSQRVTGRHNDLSCERAGITTHASAPGARVVTLPVITNLSVGVGPSRTKPRLAPCRLPSARVLLATVSAASALWAATAHADPCTAPVSGYRAGQVISAPIVHGIDGDGLCLMLGRDPSQWLEIRLADFYAPELNERGGREAKRVMDRLVGRRAVCTVQRGHNGRTTSFDRVVASCRVDGVSIGDRLKSAGVVEGGRGR